MNEPIGFIGLGSMGSALVRRLLEGGQPVVGWNRTMNRAQPLVEAGMQWASTPAEVARGVDVVFTSLIDGRAMTAVFEGPDGLLEGLGAGDVLVDLSTIGPDESRALADRVSATGATMLDAPVSGTPATIEAGRLSVMVGGDRATFEAVEPLLLALGPTVTYIGDNGQALLLKMAINLSLVVQGMSFCESVAMAEKAGIDRKAAVDVILKSVIASPMLGYRGPMILEGGLPETPYANVHLQQKDQLLGLGMAQKLGVTMPFASLANEYLTACRSAGLADEEWIAVYEVFRRLDGLA